MWKSYRVCQWKGRITVEVVMTIENNDGQLVRIRAYMSSRKLEQ